MHRVFSVPRNGQTRQSYALQAANKEDGKGDAAYDEIGAGEVKDRCDRRARHGWCRRIASDATPSGRLSAMGPFTAAESSISALTTISIRFSKFGYVLRCCRVAIIPNSHQKRAVSTPPIAMPIGVTPLLKLVIRQTDGASAINLRAVRCHDRWAYASANCEGGRSLKSLLTPFGLPSFSTAGSYRRRLGRC